MGNRHTKQRKAVSWPAEADRLHRHSAGRQKRRNLRSIIPDTGNKQSNKAGHTNRRARIHKHSHNADKQIGQDNNCVDDANPQANDRTQSRPYFPERERHLR